MEPFDDLVKEIEVEEEVTKDKTPNTSVPPRIGYCHPMAKLLEIRKSEYKLVPPLKSTQHSLTLSL